MNWNTYNVDNPVKVLEALGLQHSRVHVILEMAVVEWKTQAVETLASEELDILFGEKVLQPLVKEELVLLLAQDFEHGSAML